MTQIQQPLSKTNKAVEEILKDLEATKEYNGTCAVFCDNYRRLEQDEETGKKKETFSLFYEIKRKLVEAGIPENQIVVMESGMSIEKKEKIFAQVNEGSVRVILGSTRTLGTGVNIQQRLHLLIHMDAPDRPMDYTQRNGRILRQGNLHKGWGKTVKVLRFGVEDSLDVTSYQRLKTKSSFIDSIMDGKPLLANGMEGRVLEEEEEGLFDNPVAVLSGSQFALKKSQAERELRKYQNKLKQYQQDQIYIERQLKDNKAHIERNVGYIADYEKSIAKANETFKDGKVKVVTVAGVPCRTEEELSAAIREKITKPLEEAKARARSDYGWTAKDYPYTLSFDGIDVNVTFTIGRKEGSYINGQNTKPSATTSIYYKCPDLMHGIEFTISPMDGIKGIVERFRNEFATGQYQQNTINRMKANNERMASDNELMQQRRGIPFGEQDKLDEAKDRVAEYTKLMKDEMAEKEKKYAEAQAVESNIDLANVDTDEEEEDTNRYRSNENAGIRYREGGIGEQDALDKLNEELGITRYGSNSGYLKGETEDGEAWLVRTSDHPINETNLGVHDQEDVEYVLSIVVDKDFDSKQKERLRKQAFSNFNNTISAPWHYQVILTPEEAVDPWTIKQIQRFMRTGNGSYVGDVFFRDNNENDFLPWGDNETIDEFLPRLNDFLSGKYNAIKRLALFEKPTGGTTGGEYNYEKGIIRIFAEKGRDKKWYETVLFHEGLHAFLDENNLADDEMFTRARTAIESMLPKKKAEAFSEWINEAYGEEYNRQEEYFVNAMAFMMVEGEVPYCLEKLPADVQKFMTDYFNTIGYEPEREHAERSRFRDEAIGLGENAFQSGRNTKGVSGGQTYREVKEDEARRGGESSIGAKQERARQIAERLGISISIVTDIQEITDNNTARLQRKRRAKGWYDLEKGEVVIVPQNNENEADIEATILHEVVGHKALRTLVGEENFNGFLDKVFTGADEETRRKIVDLAAKNGWDFRLATEEYIAQLAERGFSDRLERSFWEKVRDFFLGMLHQLKITIWFRINDADLRYMLWRSYKGQINGAMDLAEDITMQMNMQVGDYAESNKNVNFVSNERRGNQTNDNDRTERNDGTGVAENNARRLGAKHTLGDTGVFEEELAAQRSRYSEADGTNYIEGQISESLIDVAKREGKFIPWEEATSAGTRLHGNTKESICLVSEDQSKITKLKDPFAASATKGNTPFDIIEELIVHNELFPETAYRLVGITQDRLGDMRFILEQDYIKYQSFADENDIAEHLQSLGLKDEGRFIFGDERCAVLDAYGENVLVDENGNLRFIDPIIRIKQSPDGDIRYRSGEARDLYEQAERRTNKKGRVVNCFRICIFDSDSTTQPPEGGCLLSSRLRHNQIFVAADRFEQGQGRSRPLHERAS